MDSEPPVSEWLGRLADEPQAGAQALWEAYYAKLVALARKKLRSGPRRVADEEDVALSAFQSFCEGARAGRFPQLADRQDLWRILVVIAARKAARQQSSQRRAKRGGGRVRGESLAFDSAAGPAILAAAAPPVVEPAFACQVAEEFELLLAQLTEPGWRDVALLKLDGWNNREIAGQLGCSLRTVERRLEAIREIWSQETRG
jgi:DNA-directed RNA polymerase specialized sigma24 family protein